MSLPGFPQSSCMYLKGSGVGAQAEKPWGRRKCEVLVEA